MANVAVIGAQWGDEGKGKVVDWLASRAEIVVRFQGGHNAGHTLDRRQPDLQAVAASERAGAWQARHHRQWRRDRRGRAARRDRPRPGPGPRGHAPTRLRIADNAVLILPLHGAIDRAREAARGEKRIGTTGRGIGPAYEDKVARRAIRVADLAEPDTVSDKLDELLLHHNTLLRGLGAETFDKAALLDRLLALAPRILPYAEPVWERLDEARRAGTRVLFEGAQAVMLDVDHGTYPFVTSSNTVAATAASGSGLGPSAVGTVLGIAKAYTTRVGSGPFPTELHDATGALLGDRGQEFGVVTGRRRRCGWFDAALVRHAVKVGGIHGLALTKLDVLDGMPELRICTGYRIGGAAHRHLPASPGAQAAAQPEYETVEGWSGSTRGARSWADLPAQAIKYVRRIEELVEAPVTLLSTSPERDDTILVRDPFEG